MIIFLFEYGLWFFCIVFGVMKWGFWGYQFNIQDMFWLMEESVDYGVIIFDYVDIYGNYIIEVEFGEALKFKLGFWG